MRASAWSWARSEGAAARAGRALAAAALLLSAACAKSAPSLDGTLEQRSAWALALADGLASDDPARRQSAARALARAGDAGAHAVRALGDAPWADVPSLAFDALTDPALEDGTGATGLTALLATGAYIPVDRAEVEAAVEVYVRAGPEHVEQLAKALDRRLPGFALIAPRALARSGGSAAEAHRDRRGSAHATDPQGSVLWRELRASSQRVAFSRAAAATQATRDPREPSLPRRSEREVRERPFVAKGREADAHDLWGDRWRLVRKPVPDEPSPEWVPHLVEATRWPEGTRPRTIFEREEYAERCWGMTHAMEPIMAWLIPFGHLAALRDLDLRHCPSHALFPVMIFVLWPMPSIDERFVQRDDLESVLLYNLELGLAATPSERSALADTAPRPVPEELSAVELARALGGAGPVGPEHAAREVLRRLRLPPTESRELLVALGPALSDERSQARALELLVERYASAFVEGDPAAEEVPVELVEGLARALADERSSTRVAAARLLGAVRVEGDSNVTSLVGALEDGREPGLRAVAATGLGRFPEPEQARIAVPALAAALARDGDASVRIQAAQVLGRGSELRAVAVAALLRAARTDPNPRVRSLALGHLRGTDVPPGEVMETLVAALADGDPQVRGSAVRVLGSFGAGARVAEPELLRCLRDECVSRTELLPALVAVDPTGSDGIGEALLEEVDSWGPQRRRALGWLAELEGAEPALVERIVTELDELTRDEDFRVYQPAVRAIVVHAEGHASARRVLVRELAHEDTSHRFNALEAAGREGVAASVLTQVLERFESAEAPAERRLACKTLGSIDALPESERQALAEARARPTGREVEGCLSRTLRESAPAP